MKLVPTQPRTCTPRPSIEALQTSSGGLAPEPAAASTSLSEDRPTETWSAILTVKGESVEGSSCGSSWGKEARKCGQEV